MKKILPIALWFLLGSFGWCYQSAAQCTGSSTWNAINLGTISAGNTYTYTHDNSDPCYGNDMGQTSNDIYYQFYINTATQVNISHCGTGFDTYLWLLDASESVVTYNDDNGPLCAGTAASITYSLTPGTYYVVSEGYGSNAGNITTQISIPGSSGSSGGWAASGSNLYNTNTGNVGIGTTNPQQKLDVSGSISSSSLNDGSGVARMVTVTNGLLGYQPIPSGGGAYLPLSGGTLTGNITLNSSYEQVVNGGANSWGGYPGVAVHGGDGQFRYHGTSGVLNVYADGNFYATDNNYLVLHAGNYNNYALPLSGGNLTGPLSLNGGATSITLDRSDLNTESLINFKTGGTINWHFYQDNGNNNLQIQRGGSETDAAPRLRFNGADGNIVLGLNGGSVGIGTNNMGDAAYKLFVASGIRTPKIKVDPTAWADYVFEASYKLPSLAYVESFIRKHKHLPEMPSAAEVAREGLDVGENQALLLKKIEELTLYVIEQNRKMEQLQKELESLKAAQCK